MAQFKKKIVENKNRSIKMTLKTANEWKRGWEWRISLNLNLTTTCLAKKYVRAWKYFRYIGYFVDRLWESESCEKFFIDKKTEHRTTATTAHRLFLLLQRRHRRCELPCPNNNSGHRNAPTDALLRLGCHVNRFRI